jgi:hypothetical protein
MKVSLVGISAVLVEENARPDSDTTRPVGRNSRRYES